MSNVNVLLFASASPQGHVYDTRSLSSLFHKKYEIEFAFIKSCFTIELPCNCPERRKSTICRRIGSKEQQVSAVKGVRTRTEAQQHQVNVGGPRTRVHLLSGRPPRGVALPLSLPRDCEASHVRL